MISGANQDKKEEKNTILFIMFLVAVLAIFIHPLRDYLQKIIDAILFRGQHAFQEQLQVRDDSRTLIEIAYLVSL